VQGIGAALEAGVAAVREVLGGAGGGAAE